MTGFHDHSLHLLVDLTPLAAGGANGGIKPLLWELLGRLGRQRETPVRFTYLTSSPAHAEVRALARASVDELVCVRDTGVGTRPTGDERGPRERLWPDPPADLAARLGADVIFCPLTWHEFHCPGVPLVSTVVDVLHRDYPWTLRPEENAHRERLYAEMLRVTDRFQCISDFTRERLRACYGVPAARTFRTHAVLPARPAAGDGSGPGEVGRADPFFFYPANFWVHKNHEVLLLAYHLYRQEARRRGDAPPWPLVLTGHDDARAGELRTLAEVLGPAGEGDDADGGVRFLGHVDARRLESLWRTAGALVFPSLHEGFGIPLTEAMAHGVPILCGAEGAVPEVVGDACLSADMRRPRDLAAAMTRLAGNGDLRRELAERGRARGELFSPAREAGHLLTALRETAARPPRVTTKGWWPEDGWTGPTALFGPLRAADPGHGPGRVHVRLHPMPAVRRLRLREGPRPLGAWDLAPGGSHEFTVAVRGGHGPLVIEVPDAGPLSPEDPRPLGVRVRDLRLRWSEAGHDREISLLPEPSGDLAQGTEPS